MSCSLSEEELWSGLDREAPEVTAHVAECATCQARAAEFRSTVEVVAAASKLPPAALPAQIGSYRVRRRLGQGGMGIVYEGEQSAPRRLVAIKVVRGGLADGHLDEYRVRLFHREAQTLARLKHPAIAAIFEGGRTADGQHFFAMELVRGVPLNEYVRDRRVPRGARLRLFCRICDAINYAHQRGVIHRDLKPSNILIDADGNPKILDFGLARITDAEAAITTTTTTTMTGRIMGTLAYMSPEEAGGNPDEIDVRGDVYSLGVVLYELLTDKLPYTVSRAALPEAVRVIREEPPRRPGGIDRSLRGDLETITLKALEKEPARRYQSAAALAEDLQRYLKDEPILARRAGVVYRARKFVVRHKVFVLALLTMAGLSAAGGVWVLEMERELRRSTEIRQDLMDRLWAINLHGAADAYYETGQYDKGEQLYQSALATFERLGISRHVGIVKLALARLLTDRAGPGDLDKAERLILDALRDVFDRDPVTYATEQRAALEQLLVLYGPEKLNAPEAAAAIGAELAGRAAARSAAEETGAEGRAGELPDPGERAATPPASSGPRQ